MKENIFSIQHEITHTNKVKIYEKEVFVDKETAAFPAGWAGWINSHMRVKHNQLLQKLRLIIAHSKTLAMYFLKPKQRNNNLKGDSSLIFNDTNLRICQIKIKSNIYYSIVETFIDRENWERHICINTFTYDETYIIIFP